MVGIEVTSKQYFGMCVDVRTKMLFVSYME